MGTRRWAFSHAHWASTIGQPFYQPLHSFCFDNNFIISQFLAMDASARVTMKDAAKCDKRCEWQNSANQ